jgi:hypothetical protein
MKEEVSNVSGRGATDSIQRQGGECVISSQSGGFAGGGAEKTPAGDYSINTQKDMYWGQHRSSADTGSGDSAPT